jgi:pimeloyl-ACP methyl ester carboxylesterase
MDSMNIRRAILVGHSIGGYELTHFGAMYPDRVIGLIYLDAGSDRVAEDSIRKALGVAAQPTSTTSPSPQRIMPTDADSASPKAAWAYRQRVGLTDNTEQAVRASYFYEGFNPYLGNYNPVPAKMLAEIAAGERTPFAKVLAPAIFIFAGTNDPVALAHRQFVSRELKGSEMVSIPGARHLIFISHPDLVESYMKEFLSKLPGA